jgi:hypothetical protein
MNIPPTTLIPDTGNRAIAVWYDAPSSSFRYVITLGEQPASVWSDPRDGWEPFRLIPGKDTHAAAYMAMRDSDPYDHYHNLRAALTRALSLAVRAHKKTLSR